MNEEVARAAAAAAAAAEAAADPKKAKGKGPAAAESDKVLPDPCPDPGEGLHRTPKEVRRLVRLRLRPVLPPTAEDGASGTGAGAGASVVTGGGASGGGLNDGETLGPPLPLWLRRRTLSQHAADPARFALLSVAYVDGSRAPAPRAPAYPPLVPVAVVTAMNAARYNKCGAC